MVTASPNVIDMADRAYGEVPGFPPGSTFRSRDELSKSRVHGPNMAGIWGGKDGAESIVISGGYVDDVDLGTEIIYTGGGGNDPNTKRQIADQELVGANAGLVRSQLDGNPVRVTRGSGGDPAHSPASGFRYDGLYRVVDHWHEIGKDGYRIWRFRLVTIDSTDAPSTSDKSVDSDSASEPPISAARASTVIQRIIRTTKIAREVKLWHDHRCQVCGLRLETATGPYAEAAHIQGLGRPHNGPDVHSNILCLCPNHHILFDAGAIVVEDDGTVLDTTAGVRLGQLRRARYHVIEPHYLKYHREHHRP